MCIVQRWTACDRCVKHSTDCVFDEDSDKRRKVILKRRMQGLEEDQDILTKLISTLQGSNEEQLLHLLQQFRKVVSVDDIKEFIDEHLQGELERTCGSVDITGLSLERMRMQCTAAPKTLDLLLKEPLYDVHSIHLWTDLVDDATASHLFSLYFSWENQIWYLVDPVLLLQDLNAGRRRFCTALLILSVLFHACVRRAFSFV